jgi:hypothetical protein
MADNSDKLLCDAKRKLLFLFKNALRQKRYHMREIVFRVKDMSVSVDRAIILAGINLDYFGFKVDYYRDLFKEMFLAETPEQMIEIWEQEKKDNQKSISESAVRLVWDRFPATKVESIKHQHETLIFAEAFQRRGEVAEIMYELRDSVENQWWD